jgi:transposase-like protein
LDSKRIADLQAKDGQLILPLFDLVENAQCALDVLIDVMGRATIEAVLRMSAEAIAGPRQQGKKSNRDIVYQGTQKRRVALKGREIVFDRPRLRRRHPQEDESAEVEIPAYEAMRGNSRLAERMFEILISGVSTRRYEPIFPEMAGTVGVSKNQVSRATIEAGERLLDDLAGRDFSGLDLLAVWIDGIQLGPYEMIGAAGVDHKGHKHVLGLREGATENAEVARALLEDLAGRGVASSRRRLLVIDGAAALRQAADRVFGVGTPV